MSNLLVSYAASEFHYWMFVGGEVQEYINQDWHTVLKVLSVSIKKSCTAAVPN